ncbi:MAG: uroporphyrinogen-III synthase [Bacteroidota bacterium]
MTHIFISRKLAPDSPFLALKASYPYLVIQDEPLIDLIPVYFENIAPCDWIFFSSKNGVFNFFQQIKKLNIKIPAKVKWGAIGLGTSREMLKNQVAADFLGNGHPDEVGISFSTLVKNQIVLFPTAKNSKESIQSHIGTIASKIINLPVYDNLPKLHFEIEPAELYIFTSPLNVQAFAATYTLQHKKCLAIGESTAKELKAAGATMIYKSEIPSEEMLVKTAQTILHI